MKQNDNKFNSIENDHHIQSIQNDLHAQLIHSITDAKIADADSVVLLENIKLQNYDNENRHDGFNTEVTLAVLKVFHIKWIICLLFNHSQKCSVFS